MRWRPANATKNRYDQAILDYTKALEIEPRDAQIYKRRARAYIHKEDYDRALSDYSKALELNPRDAETPLFKAILLEGLDQLQDAIESYISVTRIESSIGMVGWTTLADQRIKELYSAAPQQPSPEEQSGIQVTGRVFCDGTPRSFRTVYLVSLNGVNEGWVNTYEEYLRGHFESPPLSNRTHYGFLRGLYKSKTDKDGEYSFRKVDPGVYAVTLRNPLIGGRMGRLSVVPSTKERGGVYTSDGRALAGFYLTSKVVPN